MVKIHGTQIERVALARSVEQRADSHGNAHSAAVVQSLLICGGDIGD